MPGLVVHDPQQQQQQHLASAASLHHPFHGCLPSSTPASSSWLSACHLPASYLQHYLLSLPSSDELRFALSHMDAAESLKLRSEDRWDEEEVGALDLYTRDEFRMFEFKVRRCMRGRSHDWTECPFAHPGEKARRRDPRRFHYCGTPCPDYRKGSCKRGDACDYAHGVFECWLHPARYRTQLCKDGRSCLRRVCFFAHTPDQLRLLPTGQPATPFPLEDEPNASPRLHRNASSKYGYLSAPPTMLLPSPKSTLLAHSLFSTSASPSPSPLSPPLSPSRSPPLSPANWSSPRSLHSDYDLSSWSSAPSHAPALPPLHQSLHSDFDPTNWSTPPSHGSPVHHSSLRSECSDFALEIQEGMRTPAHQRRHLHKPNSPLYLSISDEEAMGISPQASPTVRASTASRSLDLISLLNQGGQQIQCSGMNAAVAGKHSREQCAYAAFSSQTVPATPSKGAWDGLEFVPWHLDSNEGGEPVLERVESGRSLRAKIFESLIRSGEQLKSHDEAVEGAQKGAF